jgi:hypothetical protein
MPRKDLNGSNYTSATDFSAEHPDWTWTIRSEAAKQFRAAFDKLPMIVPQKAPSTFVQSDQPITTKGFEHTNYVNGMWKYKDSPDQPVNGFTDSFGCPSEGDRLVCYSSYIYYPSIMSNAQLALGFINNLGDVNGVQIPLSPSYPPSPSTSAQFQQIMKAIGFAIGAVSAHETGHQLSLPNMECTQCPEPYVYQIDGSGGNYE